MTSQRIRRLVLDPRATRDELAVALAECAEALDRANAKLALADGLAVAARDAIRHGVSERLSTAVQSYAVYAVWTEQQERVR